MIDKWLLLLGFLADAQVLHVALRALIPVIRQIEVALRNVPIVDGNLLQEPLLLVFDLQIVGFQLLQLSQQYVHLLPVLRYLQQAVGFELPLLIIGTSKLFVQVFILFLKRFKILLSIAQLIDLYC